MRELLDASSQRMIKILEILLEREDWTTFACLASMVEASERTIANDISLLKDHWNVYLNIEVTNNGVRLHNQNIASVGLVFTEIFNDSVALRWIKELLFHPNNTLEFYEDKLFVSRSTLMRMLPKINRFLKTKEMSIQYKDYRYQFIGEDEQYLRDFTACFLLELYGLDLKKYDLDIDLTVINELILLVSKQNLEPRAFSWIIKDDIYRVYQMMFYIVSLVREQQGYTVDSNYPIEKEVGFKYINHLRKSFPLIHLNNLRPIHEYIYKNIKGWTSQEEELLVTQEISTFYERLFSAVSIWPDEDKQYAMNLVLKFLYLKAKIRRYKTSELFDRVHYFSLLLKTGNPYLYRVTEENLKLLSENIKFDIPFRVEDVLYWMCLSYPEIVQPTKPKTALIVSDFGAQHAQFVAKILSDFFYTKYGDFNIDIAAYPTILTSETHGDYDVLITTIPNLPLSHTNIVLINDYPNSNDFYGICKAIFSVK